MNNNKTNNTVRNNNRSESDATEEESLKITDRIDLLKQMESIDSFAAYSKVRNRIGEHSRKISVKVGLQKAAAVLIIPLLTFTLWQTFYQNSIEHIIVENNISTPATLRSTFILPDGTKVWLNGSSSLSYPTQFSNNERLVKLNGEAYFEVASDKQKPFRVVIGSLYVEAVGTAFNCMAFENDQKTEILLTEGKVNIMKGGDLNKQFLMSLEPSQMASYSLSEGKLSRRNVDPLKYVAWRDGKIIFKNDQLKDVLVRLERWYNVQFEIDHRIKGDYAFTGSFAGEELGQILKYIELTTPLRFEVMKSEMDANQLLMKKKIKIKPLS